MASDPRTPADSPDIFDAPYYRGVLFEHIVTAIALCAFYGTKISHRLAGGIDRLTGGRWWLANALYLGLMIFGLLAVLFPIHHARARRLARAVNAPERSDAGWFFIQTRAVLPGAVLAFLFFNTAYALLHWTPHRWWIIAAAVYGMVDIVIPELLSGLVIPHLYQPQPLSRPELENALLEMAARAGRPLEGVGVWSEEDSAHFPEIVLAGRRRPYMLLPAFLLSEFSTEEVVALAAREIGRAQRRQRHWRIAVGVALAFAGFAAVHYGATTALRRLGSWTITTARDPAGFPLLALAILAASAITQPALRAQRRAQEFAADEFAARLIGAPVVAYALRRLLGDPPERPRWIEWLFDDRPSLQRRLARLGSPNVGD